MNTKVLKIEPNLMYGYFYTKCVDTFFFLNKILKQKGMRNITIET